MMTWTVESLRMIEHGSWRSSGFFFLLCCVALASSSSSSSPYYDAPHLDCIRNVRRRPQRSATVTSAPFSRILHSSSSNLQQPQPQQLQLQQQAQVTLVARRRSSKMWPPWPFSLLTADQGDDADDTEEYDSRDYSRVSLMWSLTRLSARIGLNKARQVASQLWFHLPPMAPPFLILATIPQKQRVEIITKPTSTAAQEIISHQYKTVIPVLSSPFARNVALAGFALAIMSWGHHEYNHRRPLTPLPLAPAYRDMNLVVLPPFLPEELSTDSFSRRVEDNDKMILLENEATRNGPENGNDDDDDERLLPPRLQRHWNSLVGKAPKHLDLKTTMRDWKREREQRKLERANARRLSIYNELLALQSLKKQAKAKQFSSSSSIHKKSSKELGYALVTGASRGIGRAIAVELARYEIPLILVARDIDRLGSLAYDIEACYGVKCCILQADLSKADVAERLYNTTRDAGLKVDLLINNAGFSMQGPSFDLPLRRLTDMIQLNAVSASTLTHLYGGDMKRRHRGRILMLSSICGSVAGLPTVAVYAATKAFENSLGLALAKEMEPHGVGVTCVMPGAVRGTEFKSRSNSDQALCWKLPFYTRTPQQVADMAVRATLRGDTETTPGWQNRVFLKVLKPAVPQRIHNILAETAWNPLKLPSFRKQLSPTILWPYVTPDNQEQDREVPNPEPQAPIRPRVPFQNPPRVLQLQKEKTPKKAPAATPPPTQDKIDEQPNDTPSDSSSSLNEDGANEIAKSDEDIVQPGLQLQITESESSNDDSIEPDISEELSKALPDNAEIEKGDPPAPSTNDALANDGTSPT